MALALAAVLGGCVIVRVDGLTIPTSRPGGGSEQVPATLFRPEGPGPLPAVVIRHDCGGLGPRNSAAAGWWASELLARGYVILLPDSFSTRGHPGGVCGIPSRAREELGPARRVNDAFAALAYLRTLPYVDGRRVGLMGTGHGGTTTLLATASGGPGGAAEARAGYAAAVALSPACAASRPDWDTDASGVYRPAAPLLLLIGTRDIGARDDWMLAFSCSKLAEDAQQAGQPVAIKIYPGALRLSVNTPGGRGAARALDDQAWANSLREVAGFFSGHLEQQ